MVIYLKRIQSGLDFTRKLRAGWILLPEIEFFNQSQSMVALKWKYARPTPVKTRVYCKKLRVFLFSKALARKPSKIDQIIESSKRSSYQFSASNLLIGNHKREIRLTTNEDRCLQNAKINRSHHFTNPVFREVTLANVQSNSRTFGRLFTFAIVRKRRRKKANDWGRRRKWIIVLTFASFRE